MANAILLQDGDDQVLIIPPEFALPCEKVHIRWQGESIVLTPVAPTRDEAAPAQ